MFKLAEAELDTMLVLWECKEPIRPSQLLIRINENGHTWTISTLQTLLARLWAKGAVKVTNQKRFRHYAPALSREAYLAATNKRLTERLTTYSPISLVDSLVESNLMSEEDLEKALKLIREKKK